MIKMDSQTQLKIDIIAKVTRGEMTISDAQTLLSQSKRTVERYVQRYKKEGIQFVIHKNTFHSPPHKKASQLRRQVQALIKEKYHNFNLTHLREKLEECEGISVKRETLRNWAHEINLVKRPKKRRGKIRKRRDRMPSPGLLVQMDGSPHRWFGDSKSCLIAAIDDANSELHGEFFPSETTLGCMKVLHDLIYKNGLFKVLYVDKAGIFSGAKRFHFSQVSRACKELGIEIIFANSPEAKGRIERAFGTLQDRLVAELDLNNITSMLEANRYLKDKFLPEYWNKKLTVKPENPISSYKPIPSNLNLSDIFILKETRKIKNDHTFSYQNKTYKIDNHLNVSLAHRRVEIRISSSSEPPQFYFGNEKLNVSEAIEVDKCSIINVQPEKKKTLIHASADEKLRLIELAYKTGNISKACREINCSRQTFYNYKEIIDEHGIEYLEKILRKEHLFNKINTRKSVEQVVNFSLQNPHLGEEKVAKKIKEDFQIDMTKGSVRNIWKRYGMQTIPLRVEKSRLNFDPFRRLDDFGISASKCLEAPQMGPKGVQLALEGEGPL